MCQCGRTQSAGVALPEVGLGLWREGSLRKAQLADREGAVDWGQLPLGRAIVWIRHQETKADHVGLFASRGLAV